MIAAGRHTVLYALAEAQLVAFEIAAACAAGTRPFGEKGDAEFAGNVLWIGRTHADMEHVDQRLAGC